MSDKDPFVEWLNSRFLDWEKSTGKRQKLAAWARAIGVDRNMLNQWQLGLRRPGRKGAQDLASAFGPEVYDLLGIDRPNPYLQTVIDGWEGLTREQQEEIARSVEQYSFGESGGGVAKTDGRKAGGDRTSRRVRSSGKA